MPVAVQSDAASITLSAAEYQALLADRTDLVSQLSELTERFARLQLQLDSLLRQRFGAKSENADQLTLFGALGAEVIEQLEQPAAQTPAMPRQRPVKRGALDTAQELAGRAHLDRPAGVRQVRRRRHAAGARRRGSDGQTGFPGRRLLQDSDRATQVRRSTVPGRRHQVQRAADSAERRIAARCQPGGACAGQQVHRPPAAVPAGGDLPSQRPTKTASGCWRMRRSS